jgi:hypothetical protein
MKFHLPLIGILEADKRIDPQGDGGYCKYYLAARISKVVKKINNCIYLCIVRRDGDLAILYDIFEAFDDLNFNITDHYETT